MRNGTNRGHAKRVLKLTLGLSYCLDIGGLYANISASKNGKETFEEVYKAVDAFKQCEYAIRKQPVKLMDGKTISAFEEYREKLAEANYSRLREEGYMD